MLSLENDILELSKDGDDTYSKTVNLSKYKNGIDYILNEIKLLGSKVSNGEVSTNIQDLAEILLFSSPEQMFELTADNNNLNLVYRPNTDFYKYFPNESNKTKGVITATLSRDKIKKLLGPISATDDHTLSLDGNTLKLGKESDSNYLKTVDLSKYVNNNILVGSGRPDVEGHPQYRNYTKGSIYIDQSITDGALLWVRDGIWRVLIGDTGWRTLTTVNTLGRSVIEIRRINNTAYLNFGGLDWGLFGHKKFSEITSKKDNKSFRLAEPGNIPNGYRQQWSYLGSVISDINTPGQIVGTYYVGGMSDSNFIKMFYNSKDVPNTDVSDLRLQPGTWSVHRDQPWPRLN